MTLLPDLKAGIDFSGQVWKTVWKMSPFGLKYGQDLENRAAYPHQEFPGVAPPPRGGGLNKMNLKTETL